MMRREGLISVLQSPFDESAVREHAWCSRAERARNPDSRGTVVDWEDGLAPVWSGPMGLARGRVTRFILRV